jgi:hypothetical protein
VKTNEEKMEIYEGNEGFEESDWEYFPDAAAFHRFPLLHELLPDMGLFAVK